MLEIESKLVGMNAAVPHKNKALNMCDQFKPLNIGPNS